MITVKEWAYLCSAYDKWCSFKEVEHCTYEEAENYIMNMPILIAIL